MADSPTQVANLVLDACGMDEQLGNIEQGGRSANVCLRAYGKCFRELMRGAPWAFARKQAPLLLLADASGQSQGVGTTVPGTQFQYEYAYPTDCARVRYIPWNPFQSPPVPAGNIVPPNNQSPLTTAQPQPTTLWQPIRPSQFVVTNDPNYPAPPNSSFPYNQGQSPIGSTVILSNVQYASCVYTFNAIYPSLWDPLFLGAMVAYMASEVVLPLKSRQPQIAMALRKDQIALAKMKINEARVADGNEMTTGVDHTPDWIRSRRVGGSGFGSAGWGTGGDDWGVWGMGWAGSVGFADGTAY